MVKKPMKVLVCAKCGLPIKQSGWTNHWKNVHKIDRRNARKVLGDDEFPTNPQWLDSDDKLPMVNELVNETSKKIYLDGILDCMKEEKKIPWHLRDYTFRLLKAEVIEAYWLDWGKVKGTSNVVRQREKDDY